MIQAFQLYAEDKKANRPASLEAEALVRKCRENCGQLLVDPNLPYLYLMLLNYDMSQCQTNANAKYYLVEGLRVLEELYEKDKESHAKWKEHPIVLMLCMRLEEVHERMLKKFHKDGDGKEREQAWIVHDEDGDEYESEVEVDPNNMKAKSKYAEDSGEEEDDEEDNEEEEEDEDLAAWSDYSGASEAADHGSNASEVLDASRGPASSSAAAMDSSAPENPGNVTSSPSHRVSELYERFLLINAGFCDSGAN